MAVTSNRDKEQVTYYGYSTDTKPMGVEVNSLFYVYDTRESFIYTGTEWLPC